MSEHRAGEQRGASTLPNKNQARTGVPALAKSDRVSTSNSFHKRRLQTGGERAPTLEARE